MMFGRSGNRAPGLRLFCLPYAGGSASIYSSWSAGLPKAVQVCPLELPGRGMRMAEPLVNRLRPLVDAVGDVISASVDCPFAIFGHSMGALLAFEVARTLAARRQIQPVHLLVSGHGAPHLEKVHSNRHLLGDAEFIAQLRTLNGTPDEVLNHGELLSLMLPVLRSDFSVVETWVWQPGPPLSCPVTAFGGAADSEVRTESLTSWGALTTGPFALQMFPGDHFYLASQRAELLRVISGILTGLLDTTSSGRVP